MGVLKTKGEMSYKRRGNVRGIVQGKNARGYDQGGCPTPDDTAADYAIIHCSR